MKIKFKQQVAYIFSAIAVLSYLSIKNETPTSDTLSVFSPAQSSEILLLQKDTQQSLIPLTIPIAEMNTTEEKLIKMVEMMTTQLPMNEFSPSLPQGCELLNVELDEGNAKLDLSDPCFNYAPQDELKMVEALVWGATQFDEVAEITLQYNQEDLSVMPINKTPLTMKLDRQIGINNFEWGSHSLHDTKLLNIYYVKTIQGKDYLIPKSKRIQQDNLALGDVLNTIVEDISVSSGMVQPLAIEDVNVEEVVWGEDGVLNVHLNASILDEEYACKEMALAALVLSVHETLGFQQIRLYVDGVIVNAHGSNEEVISIEDLKVNPIFL